MNEFQMIPEVLYQIPEANVYASTSANKEKKLCGIQAYKIMPDMAEVALQMIISGQNITRERLCHFRSDMNAISSTQISLSDYHGLWRVLLSNFKSCYVLKKVDSSNHGAPCAYPNYKNMVQLRRPSHQELVKYVSKFNVAVSRTDAARHAKRYVPHSRSFQS
uniref:Putative secreted protein n=1 Tax=Ixodes ricinus TaxID=34613 RepID=A0A147BH73_IXORI